MDEITMAKKTPQTTPVSDAAAQLAQGQDRPAIDEQLVGRLRADGAAFYDSEVAITEFVKAFRPVMKTATQEGDFVRYTELARQWRIGYEQSSQKTRSDAVKLTDRSQTAFLRRMKEAQDESWLGDDRLIGEKPKSIDQAAIVKRAQREAAAALINAAIADKSLVQLGKEAAQARRRAEQATAATLKASQALAKAGDDAEAKARAELKLAEAREAARRAEAEAQQAAAYAETKEAKIRREQEAASAEELKAFRERARKLLAEANKVQILQVIKLLESAGVKTAEEKKAAEDAAKLAAANVVTGAAEESKKTKKAGMAPAGE